MSQVPNNSGFFYGQVVPPETGSTDALIAELTAQVAQVTSNSSAAEAASVVAVASANNAKISETNVSTLAQQATATLSQANTALDAANTAVTAAQTSVTEASVSASEAANSAVSAASSLTSVQNTVAPFLSPQAQYVFTAAAGQTQWTPPAGVTFVPGIAQVFVNGVRWNRGESYDDSTGTKITFVNGLTLGFTVTVLLSLTALYPVTGVSSADTVGFLGANGVATTVSALASAATGKGAALVGFTQSGTGAVARTVLGKILDIPITPQDFGAKGDGSDSTAAMLAFFAALPGRKGVIPSGKWVCNSPVTFSDGTKFVLEIQSGATLDFSAATGIVDGAIVIGTDAGSMTALPGLAANIAKGDASFTLGSAPALNPGDVYVLWNSTQYSWLNMSGRPYFLQGEFCRVLSVSGAVVTNEKRAFDSYATSSPIQVAKWTTNTVQIFGEGKISFPGSPSGWSGIVLYNGYQCDISGLSMSGANRAHIDMRRCYESRVNGVHIRDYSANISLNYGVSMVSCFDCHVGGNSSVHTTRHGVTLTGGSITGSIPNRLCTVRDSTVSGQEFALDMHGSCEHCSFINNTIYGGVYVAGDNTVVRGGTIFTSSNASVHLGAAIYAREVLGANHLIENVTIRVMDAASGSDAPICYDLANNVSATTGIRPGTIRISNVTIAADVAATVAARVSIPAISQGQVRVSVDGVSYTRPSGSTPLFRVDGNAGGYFSEVDVRNVDGVVPYLNAVSAPAVFIDGVVNSYSPNHGVYVNIASASMQQLVDVRNVNTRLNAAGGIVVLGPGSTSDVIVSVSDCFSVSNNTANTTSTRYKASIAIDSIKLASITNNKVGDTQATATQNYSISGYNSGTIVEAQNQQLVSAVNKYSSGVTSFTSGIAALA